MLSTYIYDTVRSNLEDSINTINFFQDQVVILDDEKSYYDQAIYRLENDVYTEQVNVNDGFVGVQTSYDARITVGCRTDMFWRRVGYSTGDGTPANPPTHTLQCTKLDAGGYGAVGMGTSTVTVVDPSDAGTMITYPRNEYWEEQFSDPRGSKFYLDQRNLYGLKQIDMPYGRDIGDTFVTSFIGSIPLSSNKIVMMSPVGTGVSNPLAVDQIVSCGKTGVFPTTTKIVNITTTTVDLTTAIPGIGTTVSIVPEITLDNSAAIGVAAPEPGGHFVTFRVIGDAQGTGTGRFRYSQDFFSNPFSPETIGMAGTSAIGAGVSIYSDNSGNPADSQSWDPNLAGMPQSEYEGDSPPWPLDHQIQAPAVGAGKIWFPVGLASAPASSVGGTDPAEEGDQLVVETFQLSSVYYDLPACSTAVQNAVTTNLGIASTRETAYNSNTGIPQLKLAASQALRDERNLLNLRIWGLRCSINAENDTIDEREQLRVYLGVSTVQDVLS